ncbi:MAG: hypothetical protein M3004_07995 [Bacteroidota bacterium]|nr:hypothetical protein [Bacteroidota bacterium]
MDKTSIHFKAFFLMIVFSLNTVIGFACAIGIDMGFNTTHHHDEEATEAVVHIHKDGKKHIHHEEAKHHDEKENRHHEKENKDNCCNEKVIKFNDVDKSASHSLKATINPIFFTTFLSSFYNVNIFYTSYIDTGIKYFVRSYHPPIPDIRVAIRSFQI